MGSGGQGDQGWRVWLKEYSLRILTLQTADPQGKQNIVPDPRHAYAVQGFAMTYSFLPNFGAGDVPRITVYVRRCFPVNCLLIDCMLKCNSQYGGIDSA